MYYTCNKIAGASYVLVIKNKIIESNSITEGLVGPPGHFTFAFAFSPAAWPAAYEELLIWSLFDMKTHQSFWKGNL